MIADKLATLKVDTAVWEEKREGYHRVVFSPDLWPALVALVAAAENYVTYWRAREAVWATYGQCEDDGHIGHTEDNCPAWDAVEQASVSEGDHALIATALDELDKVLS
jgi:hypothetical protein